MTYKLWYIHRPYFFYVSDEHSDLRIDEIVSLFCWRAYPALFGLIFRGFRTTKELESFQTKLANLHIEEAAYFFGGDEYISPYYFYFCKGCFFPNPWLILKAGVLTMGLGKLLGNILYSYYENIQDVISHGKG